MANLFKITIISLLLTSCTDYGKCIKSHQESYYETTYIKVGDVMIPFTNRKTRTVCDEYEYPNGRQ